MTEKIEVENFLQKYFLKILLVKKKKMRERRIDVRKATKIILQNGSQAPFYYMVSDYFKEIPVKMAK